VIPVTTTGNGIVIAAADETAWPTRAGRIRRNGTHMRSRTGRGEMEHMRDGAPFSECAGTTEPERVDSDGK